jgi:hypothetical protein
MHLLTDEGDIAWRVAAAAKLPISATVRNTRASAGANGNS